MSAVAVVVLLPFAAAVVLALVPGFQRAAGINVGASVANFVAALTLLDAPHERGELFLLDGFNVYLIVLTTFVAMTTSSRRAKSCSARPSTSSLSPLEYMFAVSK